ncbi:AAEL010664-PA [Aedes aegypti]|uniref:AAEL010664-PA n=1 Tax=Aedes aegypti TaxID=7159 RepID=Q16S85_AEDAE|nr:AAEL010664-PA [Aedes aegypti]
MALLPSILRDLMGDFLATPPRISHLIEKSLLHDFLPDEDHHHSAIDQPHRHKQLKDVEAAKAHHQLIKSCKDGFSVNVDVSHFQPEEISVQQEDGWIKVEGKHEERRDHHGFVSRHFLRKYRLPEGHDSDKMVSTLSSDGILTIRAPKVAALEDAPKDAKEIPVVQTGKRAKAGEETEGAVEENDAKKVKV